MFSIIADEITTMCHAALGAAFGWLVVVSGDALLDVIYIAASLVALMVLSSVAVYCRSNGLNIFGYFIAAVVFAAAGCGFFIVYSDHVLVVVGIPEFIQMTDSFRINNKNILYVIWSIFALYCFNHIFIKQRT